MAKEKTEQSPKVDDRVRNIVFLIYEESAKPNWEQILRDYHIPCMYIRHDRDPKKIHWHVILCFEGKKSLKQLQEIVDNIGAANGHFEVVNSIRAMARYLIHLDDPDKFQYDIEEVKSIAIDYNNIVGLPSDKYRTIREMMAFCEEEHILSFYELTNYASIHKEAWFKCLCDNGAYIMDKFLKSKQWTWEQAMRNGNK